MELGINIMLQALSNFVTLMEPREVKNLDRARLCSGKVLGSYSGSSSVESRPGHCLF